MPVPLKALIRSSLGRFIVRLAQPAVHFVRRRSNPGLPLDHKITTVDFGSRRFNIQHRRWAPGDAQAIQQCFADAQYDMPGGVHGEYVDRVYREIVDSGRKPLILDCGANIGASALWFTARYPQAHIVAIEPEPRNAQLLRKNVSQLDVEVIEAGVGSSDGQAYLDQNEALGEMGFQISNDAAGLPTKIVSVPTILASKPEAVFVPFLLKVDIEGSEKDLFSNHHDHLDRFPLIIMEPHDWLKVGHPVSSEFFRFHIATGRDFALKHENVASIRVPPPVHPHTES